MCFVLSPLTSAFCPTPQRRAAFVRYDLPPEQVRVTDVADIVDVLEQYEAQLDSVDEAVEMLENQGEEQEYLDDDEGIQVVFEVLAEECQLLDDVNKETRTEEIQSLMEDHDTSVLESPPPPQPPKDAFAGDLVRRTKLVVQPPSAEEAAVSASLYMNPATTKIASNLVVTWEPAVAELLDRMSRVSNPTRPFLVGIIGIPGSGKSTSSEIIKAFLDVNEERSIVMPMDGFHLPLQKLAEHPNAADMIYRRGAPDTFDPAGLATALRKIAHGQEDSVCIPGFDHAKGDPVQDQHKFERERHKIVICEGIYLLHDSDGWENIKSFFDWTIYIDANVDACIERLKQRNKCIPGYTPEEIEERCDIVDRRNAELSRDSAKKYASQIVMSGAF